MSDSPQSILPLPHALLAHHEDTLGDALLHWGKRGCFPSSLLLSGPSGIGKRGFAHHLAQALLCSKEREGKRLGPCGDCPPCRKMRAGQHVDFIEIAPQGTEEGRRGSIPIDLLRGLQETQGFGAAEGSFRITLLRDAELLTPQAANSFLKILEEPPPGWIFLLTTADTSLLLPTIVSRCQRARLRPIPEETLTRILIELGRPDSEAKEAAARGMGSLGRAIRIGESRKAGSEDQSKIDRFLASPSAELLPLVEWASLSAERIGRVAEELESELAKRMREPSLRKDGMKEVTETYVSCADALSRYRLRSHVPLNRKLQAQELLAPWVGSGASS